MAGQDGCLSSSKENELSFPPHCILFRPSMEWMMPFHIGGDDLYSVYWFTC